MVHYGSRNMVYVAAAVIVIAIVAIALAATGYQGQPQGTASSTSPATVPTTVQQQPRQACTAVQGFYCNDTTFQNDNLNLQFGQNTGQNWSYATLQFVPEGQNYVYGSMMAPFPVGLRNGSSSYVGIVVLPSVAANSTVNGMLEGTIYVNYTTESGQANVVTAAASIQVAPT